MSSSGLSVLEATQNELKMWKNRYHAEHQRVLELLKNCKCAAKQDPDEKEHPKVQKKLVEIPTDPLRLPEPCAMRILHFLSPKELIDATQVSTGWKYFIESREKLMKRALDGTVVNIYLGRSKLPEAFAEVFSTQFNREYKNMQIKWDAYITESKMTSFILHPAIKLASTLETLQVSLSLKAFLEFFDHKFPNLVSLNISCQGSPFNIVPKHPFPRLTTLKISSSRADTTIATLEHFLRAFPKLKHLFSTETDKDNGFLLDDVIFPNLNSLMLTHYTQPKLETVVFCEYAPKFFRNHHATLQKLLIESMDTLGLFYCLRDLKQLKCLTVNNLEDLSEVTLPQNESIEILRIENNDLEMDAFYEVLVAVPSLKELAVHEFIDHTRVRGVIHFVALKMGKLKWLKLGQITDEEKDLYDEFKDNANQFIINTDFELTDDEDVDYETLEEFAIFSNSISDDSEEDFNEFDTQFNDVEDFDTFDTKFNEIYPFE